ncbi:MAG: DNA primase, partial [Clostridia bacterium]|nr:DNA primase [Clostridia bacterium]
RLVLKISQGFIEELKYRNKIDDVISSYVNLKRAGSNKVGLCPFHSERTPSFTVFTNTETFKCFGCGAGGDVITFIMRQENLEYISAVEFLAKRAGLEMPEDTEHKSEMVKRSRMFDMNREAARFFNKMLYDPCAKQAQEYIAKRRLSASAVKRFGLGYAPKSFDALRKHMHSLGYRDDELREAFLCGKSERTGNYFDYFRGRLIFPIIDNFGNVIAFGGRATDDESKPKYLNTSDTPVFKKSRNLFALNFARSACEEYLILCEGYMDVIAVNIAGFPNAVATLGTALTSEQARIMAKYTKKVVISYDSDDAGQAAAKRAIPLLTEAGLEVSVLKMQDAKDPDEYIKKFGAAKFRELIEGSRGKFDFLCDGVLKKHDINVPDEKVKAAHEICELIAAIHSSVERSVYIAKSAERLSLDEKSLRSDVERIRRKLGREEDSKQMRKIISDASGYGDRVNREAVGNTKAARAEETIIGLIMLRPELLVKIKKGEYELCADDFKTSFGRKVFEAVEACEDKVDIGVLGAQFSVDEIARITDMQRKRADLAKNDETVLSDSIRALKEEKNNAASGDELADALKIIQAKKKKQ